MNWEDNTPSKEWTIGGNLQIEGGFPSIKFGKSKHAITFTGEVGSNYYMLKELGVTFSRVKIKGKQYARPFYLNMYSFEREAEILDTKEYKTGEDYTFEATFQGIGLPLIKE